MNWSDVGAALVLVAAALGAIGWLATRAYRAVKIGEAIAQLVGKPGEPTLRESVIDITQQVQDVRRAVDIVQEVALRSERELHPNGGSSLRDDVRAAAVAASAAAGVAADLGVRLEAASLEASTERRDIRGAMRVMREEIADDAAQTTADALDLLAELGGPDLRPHMKPAREVAPHAHELPPHEPDLTGPPVAPVED